MANLKILGQFNGFCFALRLLAFLSFLTLSVEAESCPSNPTTSTICSQDHVFADDIGVVQVSGRCVAGGKCECSKDFTGKACEIPIRAAATNVLMNSWVFLAKSCWAANAQGGMSVTIKYTTFNCAAGVGCRPEQNTTSSDKLPQIMFYSSYDQKFSQSVLKSYAANSFGADASDTDRPCFGNSAVYKEQISCMEYAPSTVRALLYQRKARLRTRAATSAAGPACDGGANFPMVGACYDGNRAIRIPLAF
jgi:hypothetical protein